MNKIKLQQKLQPSQIADLKLATQLSRLTNAIQANKRHYIRIANDDNSLTIRDQIELIIYHGAIVYEGITTISKYCKVLRKLSCWNNNGGIEKRIILEANAKNSFTQKYLKNIRNKVIFHYDIDILSDSIISKTRLEEDVFAEAVSTYDDEIAFTFADLALIRFIIDPIIEHASDNDKWKYFQEKLIAISDDLVDLLLLCTTELVKTFTTIC